METCKNCSTTLQGKFCSECGQKSDTRRFTFHDIFIELRKQYIQLDKGLLHTIIAVAKKPGHAIREYFEGKRVGFTPAVKFLFWTAAISVVLMEAAGVQQAIASAMDSQIPGANGEGRAVGITLENFLFGHPALILLLLIPGTTLSSYFIFRKKGYNLAEYFLMNCYLTGEINLGVLVIAAGNKLLSGPHTVIGTIIEISMYVIWIGYYCWAYDQFFKDSRKFRIYAGTVFSVLLGFIITFILTTLLVFLSIVVYKSITG